MIDVTGGCLLRRAAALAAVSLGWGGGAGFVCLMAGIHAHSVALRAFGLVTLLQGLSSAALLRRVRFEAASVYRRDPEGIHAAERRFAGVLAAALLGLAVYLGSGIVAALRAPQVPDPRLWSFAVPAVGIPLLSSLWKWKWDLAQTLASDALRVEALGTLSAVWMSAVLAAGLTGDRLGLWWADVLASACIGIFVLVEAWDAGRRAGDGGGLRTIINP